MSTKPAAEKQSAGKRLNTGSQGAEVGEVAKGKAVTGGVLAGVDLKNEQTAKNRFHLAKEAHQGRLVETNHGNRCCT